MHLNRVTLPARLSLLVVLWGRRAHIQLAGGFSERGVGRQCLFAALPHHRVPLLRSTTALHHHRAMFVITDCPGPATDSKTPSAERACVRHRHVLRRTVPSSMGTAARNLQQNHREREVRRQEMKGRPQRRLPAPKPKAPAGGPERFAVAHADVSLISEKTCMM